MPLIYCGIDEAGYGPLLGPLCVGCVVLRVESWADGDAAPDLWKMLRTAVCRQPPRPGAKRRRIAVEDSKKLKLANSSVRLHPLHHLERGVLSFFACRPLGEDESWMCPSTDVEFLAAVGVPGLSHPWYAGDPLPFPCGLTADEARITANTLRLALARSGVSVVGLHAEAVCEATFNEVVEAAGTKAAVTESVLVRRLGEIWERFALVEPATGQCVRVVCDRQGGRTQYAEMLQRAFPDAEVAVIGETPAQSAYDLRSRSGPTRCMRVAFKVEAESSHMPVALASMLAKLTRELHMARFNRYWCGRMPELKPTAGYSFDARRWLDEARPVLSEDERRTLVRRA